MGAVLGGSDSSSLASVLSTPQGRSYLYYALAGLVAACCVAAAAYRYWCPKGCGKARTVFEQWIDYEEAKKRGDEVPSAAAKAPRPLNLALKKVNESSRGQGQGQGQGQGVEMSDVIPSPAAYPTLNFLHSDTGSGAAAPGGGGGRGVRTMSNLELDQFYRMSQMARIDRQSLDLGPGPDPGTDLGLNLGPGQSGVAVGTTAVTKAPSLPLPHAKRPTTMPAQYNPMAAVGGSAGRLPLHAPPPGSEPSQGQGQGADPVRTAVGLQAASVSWNPLQTRQGQGRFAKSPILEGQEEEEGEEGPEPM